MAIDTSRAGSAAEDHSHPPVTTVARLSALTLAVALSWIACSGPGEPVAEVTVATPSVRLPYPGTAELEATWTPLAPLEDPVVFVHLWGRRGRLLRTFDHPYPGDWEVGEPLTYGIELWQSALGPPLPDGRYDLTLGVTAEDERPPLAVDGEEIDDGEYVVARVEVPAPPGVAPRLRWTAGWGPPGAGLDRQILGGRWLHKAGRLTLEGVREPLDVSLLLRIPTADEMPHQLVLDEGATTPSVRVGSDCTPVTRTVEGFGRHRVMLRLVPGGWREGVEDEGDQDGGEQEDGEVQTAAGGDCTVELAADYAYLDPASLQRVAADLMRVEWSRGAGAPAAATGER